MDLIELLVLIVKSVLKAICLYLGLVLAGCLILKGIEWL